MVTCRRVFAGKKGMGWSEFSMDRGRLNMKMGIFLKVISKMAKSTA
jgi:hypothetical protein